MMKTDLQPIICGGFTPCIQRILEFKSVAKGAVNRAGHVTIGIGGKGANTARMINQLGGKAILFGFSGGSNGRLLEQMLDNEGILYRHVATSGETRICQTLVEAGNPEATELVEEMPSISDGEWSEMLSLFEQSEMEGAVVPVSGKLPAGAPIDAYGRIAEIVKRRGGRLIIDAPDQPMLCTLEHEPFMVKINDEELLRTVGGTDVISSAKILLEHGAQSVLITRGSRTAFYLDREQVLELRPPKIDAVNPVGSGDAVTAGCAVAVSAGFPVEDMLREGMACGAANALNLRSGVVIPDDVRRLAGLVGIARV
ncbi:MAG: hypothetical protein JXR25_16350 [Pontiellaceae bacterium]|nr:hypothetical protein [Pontiellaceae bacterium]MBN2786393.1 hypothetical protein [Pontiellaceae bacterium]